MLAKFADFLSPLLKPAIDASRRRELEKGIRRAEAVMKHASKEIQQQQIFKDNAIEEKAVLQTRLTRHMDSMAKPISAGMTVREVSSLEAPQ